MTALLAALVPPKSPPPWADALDYYGDDVFWVLIVAGVLANVLLYLIANHMRESAQRVYKNAFKAYDNAQVMYDEAARFGRETIAKLKAWEEAPACVWCGKDRTWVSATFLSDVGQRELRVQVDHLPTGAVKATCIECRWAPDLVGKSAEGTDVYKAHEALRALLVKLVAT